MRNSRIQKDREGGKVNERKVYIDISRVGRAAIPESASSAYPCPRTAWLATCTIARENENERGKFGEEIFNTRADTRAIRKTGREEKLMSEKFT